MKVNITKGKVSLSPKAKINEVNSSKREMLTGKGFGERLLE